MIIIFTGSLAINFAFFGVGTGPIYLDNVRCSGRETRLANCPANRLGVHNCNHFEDASVRCRAMTQAPGKKEMLKSL